MANGKVNNPSLIKNAAHKFKPFKSHKFQRMQLSLNKAKLELQEFEKNSLMLEREQRREDMVLMATQQAIMQTNQLTKIKQLSKKNKFRNRSNPLTQSTFFKYKNNSITAKDIAQPLRKFLQSCDQDSFIDDVQSIQEEQKTQSDEETQRALELEIKAFKKLHQRILEKEENSILIQEQGSRNKNMSALGLVKKVSLGIKSPKRNSLLKNFGQTQENLKLERPKVQLLSKIPHQTVQSFLQTVQSPQNQTSTVFIDKRSSFQHNLNHQRLMLPKLASQITHINSPTVIQQKNKDLRLTQFPLNQNQLLTQDTQHTSNFNSTAAFINTSITPKYSDVRPKYLKGVSSLPEIQFQNSKLYQKINGLVKDINQMKEVSSFYLTQQNENGLL